uniref:Uncharacterized protein n=1 Tax=Rhizophora mucronata TaxID=61149 RepID=A0A2P2PRK3_RHIMU
MKFELEKQQAIEKLEDNYQHDDNSFCSY